MRRDSIFYKLFAQSPTLLFELLPTPPATASDYRFDSVAVKEPTFEIDGVFLPPESSIGVVYFCEVQFQKDEFLYERVFGESFLYFYRNRKRFSNWQAVIIYPNRATEQSDIVPYQALLNSDQVHRVYLEELGDIQTLPLGVALMVLTTVQEEQAPAVARELFGRAAAQIPPGSQSSELEPETISAIMEMIKTIMIYKFTNLSRKEVEAMLGVSLQETRVYQEGREEGKAQGKEQGKEELILRQLTKRFGTLPEAIAAQVQSCSVERLDALGEALLDFSTIADLQAWLAE
jgi:predicted transposase/invertase (TIGR01784 family)